MYASLSLRWESLTNSSLNRDKWSYETMGSPSRLAGLWKPHEKRREILCQILSQITGISHGDFLLQILMKASIFFRLFCNTAVVLYIFSLEILREKLARGRPKLVSSRIPYILPLCYDSFSSLSLENMRRSHRQGFHEDDFRFHNRNVISCCR